MTPTPKPWKIICRGFDAKLIPEHQPGAPYAADYPEPELGQCYGCQDLYDAQDLHEVQIDEVKRWKYLCHLCMEQWEKHA